MYNSLLLNWEMNALENIYNYNNRDILICINICFGEIMILN